MKQYINSQVGFVQLNKPVIYTDRNYECAAWWEERASKMGVFPAILKTTSSYSKDLIIVVSVPGIVTDDYFPSLYGGVSFSNEPYKTKYVGRESRSIAVSCSLTKAILDTGTIPGSDIDWYVNPELWPLYTSYLDSCMQEEFEYFTKSWNKGDLSTIRYSSDRISNYAKDIEDVSRQIGYLNEKSDMWRNLHKQNTSWAK